jgi:hypothetical protein
MWKNCFGVFYQDSRKYFTDADHLPDLEMYMQYFRNMELLRTWLVWSMTLLTLMPVNGEAPASSLKTSWVVLSSDFPAGTIHGKW